MEVKEVTIKARVLPEDKVEITTGSYGEIFTMEDIRALIDEAGMETIKRNMALRLVEEQIRVGDKFNSANVATVLDNMKFKNKV